MSRQVIFDSFSPALLYLASQAAPEIPRELDLDGIQLLTPAQVQAICEGIHVGSPCDARSVGNVVGAVNRRRRFGGGGK